MIRPQFQFANGEMESQVRRKTWVWIVLFAICALLAAGTLAMVGETQGVTQDRQALDKVLVELHKEWLGAGLKPKTTPEFFEKAKRRLMAVPLSTKGAKSVRARALLILGQDAHPSAKPNFSKLDNAADDVIAPEDRPDIAERRQTINEALVRLYSAKSLTSEQAVKLQETISSESGSAWPIEIALEHATELSSGKEALDAAFLGMAFVGLLLLCGSVGAWVWFGLYRSRGNRPLGAPLEGSDPGVGDALGLRMIVFFVIFALVPSFLIALLPAEIAENAWTDVFSRIIVILLMCAVMALPLGGVMIGLRSVGWRSRNFGKDIFFGIGAFLFNLPIVVFLGYIGLQLQRWLPGGEHPVQNMILQPSAHIPILISGGLLAAVMEETAFRGFFFQGLLVRFRHVGWAIFCSSLAFASIHPQGITLWPVLGWIGATGAYLTRERQSLVPAVVMHALHNSVLLAISIYAS